ncbi:hypothetical protein [Nocardia wallacei]|uniref:hypothetical protein n=1 Tax=Nocardia wallacei TaxID=480035 RepID=UPI0024556386|nr:hypothetical protein [Nocardia wallacei]
MGCAAHPLEGLRQGTWSEDESACATWTVHDHVIYVHGASASLWGGRPRMFDPPARLGQVRHEYPELDAILWQEIQFEADYLRDRHDGTVTHLHMPEFMKRAKAKHLRERGISVDDSDQ